MTGPRWWSHADETFKCVWFSTGRKTKRSRPASIEGRRSPDTHSKPASAPAHKLNPRDFPLSAVVKKIKNNKGGREATISPPLG